MSAPSKAKPTFKIWLETDEGYVFGPGVYSLLKKIRGEGTIKGAAEALGMSYRFAWGLLKKAEEKMGEPLVVSHKGGRSGGGGVEITDVGLRFLNYFEQVLARFSEEPKSSEVGTLAMNGEVTEMVQKGNDVFVTLRLIAPSNVRLDLSRETFENLDIDLGDRIKLEITPSTGKVEKA